MNKTDQKILIIEDDDFLLKMYSNKLMREGYNVLVARDGEEGYIKIMRQKPDLVLLDIMMPKINGFDVLEAVKANEELTDTKIIMLTNLSQDEDKQKGEELGAVAYLTKANVQMKEVIAEIEQQLA